LKPNKVDIFVKVALSYFTASMMSIGLTFCGLAAIISIWTHPTGIDIKTNLIGGILMMVAGVLFFWKLIWRNYREEYFKELWKKD